MCIQNCTNKFDTTSKDPRLRFFGNVNVGGTSSLVPHSLPLPLESLFSHYTHVLFATGCTVPILHPALPPSEHCVPALSLVHWYTQHPSDRPAPPLEKLSHVTIIGQGNVSLDIARMLLTEPEVLAKYDVPEQVLAVLARSTVKHVSIVGRRGPFEAAFTTKELRELINLPNASMAPLDPTILQPPPDATVTRQQSRILQLLEKGSKQPFGSTPRSWSLDFFRSPTGLTPPTADGAPAQLTLAHTVLDRATRRAMPTALSSTHPTSLVVAALGQRAEPTHPWYDPLLGHVRNARGRVVGADGKVRRGVYASGWAAMGAKGVLASTLLDAHAVADTILSDLDPRRAPVETTPVAPAAGVLMPEDTGGVDVALLNADPDLERPPPEIQRGLDDGRVTTYEDWKKVDEEEIRRGAERGKERERMGWYEAHAFLANARQGQQLH